MLGHPTCNGDGNGFIDDEDSAITHEAFRFWEHLAAAGMIEGDYTGIRFPPGGAHDASKIGVNIPAARIDGVGWFIRHMTNWIDWGLVNGCLTGHPIRFDLCYGNAFQVGLSKPGDDPQRPFLTGAEARALDAKLDDGKAAQGKVVSAIWPTCSNAGSSADLNADYVTTNENTACALMFPESL